MPIGELHNILALNDWRQSWVRRGMICIQDRTRKPGADAFELKSCDYAGQIDAVGCGGWDENGTLHWVGVDFDVGHGFEDNKYDFRDDAISAALQLRDFVGGAAEIRHSKGNGVHARIAIDGVKERGRELAPLIAKWLADALEIRCDRSALGRQNLWFWARNVNSESFKLVVPCEGKWTPPPAALKPPKVLIMPTAAPTVDEAEKIRRASQYIARVRPAVSNEGGHVQALKVATLMIIGFDLGVDHARPLIQAWNSTCQPPWSDKELEHKLEEAAKNLKNYPRGFKLSEKPNQAEQQAILDEPELKASTSLKQQIEDEISGKRFTAELPWLMTTKLTRALVPKTITIFCAPQGASKSFAVTQAAQHWFSKGYNFSLLMLEEDRDYWLRRAVAQHIENADLTDTEWVEKNPEHARNLMEANSDFMDSFGASIHEVLDTISTDNVLKWLQWRVSKNDRVIVIDPITAKDPSQQPWIDDHKFMMAAKSILRTSQTSLVLVTHPPKSGGKKEKDKGWGDDVAGGVSYLRFAQTVLWLENMSQGETVEYMTAFGESEGFVNRKLQLRKTRNSKGQGHVIGFFFNGKTLKFEERGIVDR